MQILQRSPGEEYVYNLRRDAKLEGMEEVREELRKKENSIIGKLINNKTDEEISDFLEIPIERVVQYRKDNGLA